MSALGNGRSVRSRPSWQQLLLRRQLTSREKRMLLYLALLLSFATWKLAPRPWHPTVIVETRHHVIVSTASRSQTEDVARRLEILYAAYSNHFGALPNFQEDHPKLKVKLFRDRSEFRRVNPGLGWAEAFYRKPYCQAYYSAEEKNPFHWMLHESVHQLNREVAHLKLAQWLEEGLADYFATSRLNSDSIEIGRIDPDTYPVWWIDELATDAALEQNVKNQSVIRLRAIVSNSGGPSLNRNFNLYYLHWWTLTHFVLEHPKYRAGVLDLLQAGGRLRAFEHTVGPIAQIESEWHAYVRELKTQLARPENFVKPATTKTKRNPD